MEYLLANLWQVWAAIAIVCLIIELSTGGFFVICFSVGAIAAAIGSLFGDFVLQLTLFAVFSLISIFTVRPFAIKYLHKDEDHRLSNADALIGRIGTVSQRIEADGYGRVAIDGDDWKAETIDGSSANVGEKVRVVGRESIIIKVEKHQ